MGGRKNNPSLHDLDDWLNAEDNDLVTDEDTASLNDWVNPLFERGSLQGETTTWDDDSPPRGARLLSKRTPKSYQRKRSGQTRPGLLHVDQAGRQEVPRREAWRPSLTDIPVWITRKRSRMEVKQEGPA